MHHGFLHTGASPHAAGALFIFFRPCPSESLSLYQAHLSAHSLSSYHYISANYFQSWCGRPNLLYIMFYCDEDMTSYDFESVGKQLFGASVASYGRLIEDHPACTMIPHYSVSAHSPGETALPACTTGQSCADLYWSPCYLLFAQHFISQATETSYY